MDAVAPVPSEEAVQEAAVHLRRTAAERKCWTCECTAYAVGAIVGACPPGRRPAALDAALAAVQDRAVEITTECLGCRDCYPALAVAALRGNMGETAFDAGTGGSGSERKPG